MEKRKRKRWAKEKVQEEVNWTKYFAKIKGVCPWSYRAHMKETILFIDYSDVTINTWQMFLGATHFEAFVYKCPDKSSKWLTDKCAELNKKHTKYEWLWSHPEHGGDSTPIPVLIQQDRELLTKSREQVGYEDAEQD